MASLPMTLTISWAIFLSVIFFIDGAAIEEELEVVESEAIIEGKNVSRRKKYYKNRNSYGLFQNTTKSRSSSSTVINDKVGLSKKFIPRRRRRTVVPGTMKFRRHPIIITKI